jgi:signal transduction histidine kinase
MLLNLERIQAGLRELNGGGYDYSAMAGRLLALESSVQMTLEGAWRVQEIVQDLKQLSRSDHDAPRVPVDVRRVLSFSIEMASSQTAPRAQVVRAFGDVPPVNASEGRLNQVFLNLILNAAQSIPEGSPQRNEIRVVTATDARARAVDEEHDTGVGMSPEIIQQIFDPFFTTKSPGVGTGLGLAICHNIVAGLGGEISVESVEGRGSMFRVALPSAAG